MTTVLNIDDMTPARAVAWSFLSDQVMGGQSRGTASFEGEAIRLTGRVSTANRGGFIQVRAEVAPLPETAGGLVLRVRGTPQRYFVHLRTDAENRPWQFHQAAFEAGADWHDIRLPFRAFEARGGARSEALRPETVRSIGLAAYGRDHDADVLLAALGLYPAETVAPDTGATGQG